MYQCTHCGRPADLETGCPYCGSPAPPLTTELERLERDIAEMSARDIAIQKERSLLSAKMQAALHQRALVQAVQRQRERRPPKQRGGAARRVATLLPAPVRPGRRNEAQPRSPGRTAAGTGPPTAAADQTDVPRAEASSRSVQNVLLALGALLLGVAALTFTVAVLTSFEHVGRAAILVVVCAVMHMVPPLVMRRGLTATAETVTTVGLVLVPLAGHAFWQVDAVRAGLRLSGSEYAGVVCLGTAAIALAYQRATGLTAPRYVALVTLQPAVPLLTYEWVSGPAGWSLVFTGIATADLLAGIAMGSRPPAAAPSAGWLREATWILHGVAVGAALVYAVAALVTADTVSAAARAGGTLLLAAAVGLLGALCVRQKPLPDIAAGLMTLAVILSAGRVATVALPGRALVLIAGTIVVTAAAVRLLPPGARRGPQLAVSGSLAVLGVVVAGAALRAGVAPVRAVLPVWDADLSQYGRRLADAVGPAGWQVAVSGLLATVAAALAVPTDPPPPDSGRLTRAAHSYRRLACVVGTTLTALATPAAFGLGWAVTPWVLVVTAVALGLTGLTADTPRVARAHVAAALVLGLVAAASSLARPELTAGVLAALTVAGAVIGAAPRFLTGAPYADVTGYAAQGGAAAALPGAVATATSVALPDAGSAPVLAASFLAVSAALGYAAVAQVALRQPIRPVVLGGTLGALAVAIAAFGATLPDALVATLLLVGALALWLAPSVDVGRHTGGWGDGADIAAAAVTASAIGALARLAVLLAPDTGLATTAALALATALAVRLMPERWRRGPALGCGLGGGIVAAVAGYAALRGGVQVLLAASPIWDADLSAWRSTVDTARGFGAQTPLVLLLYAVTVAVVLTPWARAALIPVSVSLAVIGAPAALGLPWWSPTVLGLAVATILGLTAVVTALPRTALGWACAAAVLAGYGVAASLVAPWATAAALAGATTAAVAVAAAARMMAATPVANLIRPMSSPEPAPGAAASVGVYASPTHLVPVGGAAVTAALLALPGALAASAASLARPTDVVLAVALATTSLGLAVVALLRLRVADYLPYAAVGMAVSATAVAVAALWTGRPYGVYAAAAALLGVLTELVRTGVTPPPVPRRAGRLLPYLPDGSGVLTPGLLATAGVPTLLALASIAPALTAVLVEPHRTLSHIWAGPSAAGVNWTGTASGAAVIAALVLTLALGLAAAGFGGRAESRLTRDELLAQVVPVVIPGVAVTLLITPAGLGLGWPVGTVAALAVFTISMLGVALSPPPPPTEAARAVRATRSLVLVIGLIAGGTGLAGSLATRGLTVATLAGAVGVGLTAAVGGRTNGARVLGWAFASVSAHALALVAGLAIGLPRHWSALGVMAVAAIALAIAARLPGLRLPEAKAQASALEWTAYAGALLALVLAARSLVHLAALLAAWGAVLGIAAVRADRSAKERRILLWTAAAFELAGWWLVMQNAEVGLIEAYTLPFAALALVIGLLELRQHRELGSWAAYGPALGAAFVPTLAIVLATDTSPLRRILLLLGAVGTLIAGSMAQQRAPVVVGSVVTTIAALHEIVTVSVWLIFIPIGVLLLGMGATYEKRRRDLQRLRGALGRMR